MRFLQTHQGNNTRFVAHGRTLNGKWKGNGMNPVYDNIELIEPDLALFLKAHEARQLETCERWNRFYAAAELAMFNSLVAKQCAVINSFPQRVAERAIASIKADLYRRGKHGHRL